MVAIIVALIVWGYAQVLAAVLVQKYARLDMVTVHGSSAAHIVISNKEAIIWMKCNLEL